MTEKQAGNRGYRLVRELNPRRCHWRHDSTGEKLPVVGRFRSLSEALVWLQRYLEEK